MPILDYHDHGWRTYMRLTKILLKYDTRFDLLSLSTQQTRIPNVHDDEDKILEVPGFRLAIVDRVVQEDRLQQDRFHVSDPESVATWIDWEGQCRVLARQVYYGDTMHDNSDMPLPPNYLRVHASNMVADADRVYSDIGNDVITNLISSVREQYCGDPSGFDIPNSSTPRIFTLVSQCLHQIFREKGINGKLQGLIGECYQAIERNIGRAFFSTREGKRLGLGPPYMKPGDVVCGFYNSGPLHILRFEETADGARGGCATYIGDAYVDGFMELDEFGEEIRGRDEVFRIQ
ncbi:heterokaryon incompatibility protein [Neofusicoccum parvum]|nr:heterokaryon incompatibility protein [Neofusicoccum parvum]